MTTVCCDFLALIDLLEVDGTCARNTNLSLTPPSTRTASNMCVTKSMASKTIGREEEASEILPGWGKQVVDNIMATFHDRWAERDKAYENFINSYQGWKRFSTAARKQLEGGRHRDINEMNISAIVEEALITHQPNLQRSATEFKGLQKPLKEGEECVTPQYGCKEEEREDTLELAWALSRSTSPEDM